MLCAERRQKSVLPFMPHWQNRLGIGQIWRHEDYAFRYQQPDTYKQIAKQRTERRIVREHTSQIAGWFNEQKCSVQTSMLKSNTTKTHLQHLAQNAEERLSLRWAFWRTSSTYIADQLQDCYVRSQVSFIPNTNTYSSEFDDYVANPKAKWLPVDSYRSPWPQGKTIEIQIRMLNARRLWALGVAAHWKYKKKGFKRP